MIDIKVKHPSLQFTKEEINQILAEFNRNLDNVQTDINCIKKWFETQPHLTYVPENELLLKVLIWNKFSFEKTKKKLDYYFSIRSKIPEVFQNRLPSNKDILEMRKISRTFALPKLVNLNRVLFFVHDEMNQRFDGYTNLAKVFMDTEGLFYQDYHSNLEVVWDCSKSNLAFWTSFTPIMAKICTNYIEKSSIRTKAIRIIGLPSFAQLLVNTAIVCLPKKLQERVSSHSDPKEIAKFYPKELLPIEYGGINIPYREMSAEFDKMIDQCEDYFKHINNFKVDESLRPEPLDNDELLGFHGNFRKLEVD